MPDFSAAERRKVYTKVHCWVASVHATLGNLQRARGKTKDEGCVTGKRQCETSRYAGRWWGAVFGLAAACSAGCNQEDKFSPGDPASGPGEYVGLSKPLNAVFAGGASPDVQPRPITGKPDWEICDADCQSYCDSQQFDNPVDEAMCPHIWGAGLDTLPVDEEQACRRLFADTTGVFPSYEQISENCLGRPIAQTVEDLIESDDFVFQNQRRWADVFRYNNVAVNFERIYDADVLVGKLYSGLLRYDSFVEVMSAHPTFVRRFDDANDRAEAIFSIFVGRPPYDNERADMAKLYALWENGYLDHPEMGLRVPDAVIEHRCVGDDGKVDEEQAGACTSVLWGFNRVVLLPDHRAVDNQTLAVTLTRKEWELLQTPGRIMGTWPVVWEHAVEEVLQLYLGYDMAARAPLAVQKLVDYVLQHDGDIRAAHYAVLTSQLYLQSTECAGTDCEGQEDYPLWTRGPLRQAGAEMWIESVSDSAGAESGACDHRLSDPEQLLDDSLLGYQVVGASRWQLEFESDDVEIDTRYRNLAQTLGGCPDNEVSGRFKAIGILSTATQEAFVGSLCNPAMVTGEGVSADVLLPNGMGARQALDADVAQSIVTHQVGRFFARRPVDAELEMAETGAAACVPKPCDAESFGRALCYALLSSSEMLFY